MVTAKMREKEKDLIYEKKLLKERKVEDAEFTDKPKFITTAYKQKLLEDKKWEYEARLADEIEQRTDVRRSGMEGFYSNLLTKNVAMGGELHHAVSAFTSGSDRQHHVLEAEGSQEEIKHVRKSEKRPGQDDITDEALLLEKTFPSTTSNSSITEKGGEGVREVVSSFDKEFPETVDLHVSSKAEIIESAKSRYLVRKRNSSAMSS